MHTRKAYLTAVDRCTAWCAAHSLDDLAALPPVLTAAETRVLLDSPQHLDPAGGAGQGLHDARDRALVGLMVYTFARVGAALAMRVDDYFAQGWRMWVRLHEKGGKEHVMPCHHNLEHYLDAYLELAGLKASPAAPLFQTVRSSALTGRGLGQPDVWRMLRRRAAAAGIATGFTEYLKDGGKLELAQQMASHESPRTTSL